MKLSYALFLIPFLGCTPTYTQSPVDGGGVSFDFEGESAKLFKEDPSQPNLATNLKWRRNGAKGATFKDENGEKSITATAEVRDNDILSWDSDIELGPNPKGLTVHITFLYRSHGMNGRNARSYCILFGTHTPGWDTAFVPHSDSFNWFFFSHEFKIDPGVTKFHLCQRHDGPGDFVFKNLAVRIVKPDPTKPPVELLCSPHGYLGRTFAISKDQCGIIHYLWRRVIPTKAAAKDYSFRYELDKGFELIEPMFGDAKSVKTETRADGGTITTFNANELPGKDYNSWFRYGMMLTTKAAVGTHGKARLTVLYKGQPCSNTETLDLFVTPTIAARRPKRYMNGFQQASSTGFVPRSERGKKALAELTASAGVGFVYGAREMMQPMRKAGVGKIFGGFSASNGYQIGDGDHVPPDEKYVPRTTWHGGMDKATCPVSIYQEKPYFVTNTLPRFKKQLEGFDGAMSNWEPYYFSEQGCMCTNCCREFAKYLKRDFKDVLSDWPACVDRTKGRFGKQARDFRSWQHGQMMKVLNKYVTQYTGGKDSFGFIPEIEFGMMTSNWRDTHHMGESEVKDYADGFTWINPWGPYAGVWSTDAPYVHSPAGWVSEFYSARNIRKTASADWPHLKIMSFPNGNQCGGMIVQPEYMEIDLNAYFFNRWDASCLYFFPIGYDNRYWAALARASTLAADCEEFVWDGTRVDEKVTIVPAAGFPTGLPASSEHVPEFKNVSLVQHVAYELNGKRLVAVFNYARDQKCEFTLRFADLPDCEWKLSVPALRCVAFTFTKP